MSTAAFWIKVKNWDRHNPRKDIKKPSWFAFDNRMIEDADLFDFSHGEFKAWIYLLSKASQKTSSVVRIVPAHAEKVCGISPDDLSTSVKKLIELGMISTDVTEDEIFKARNVDVQIPNVDVRAPETPNNTTNATGQDRTGQGKTEQNRTGEDTGEPKSPSAIRFEMFQDLLKKSENEAVNAVLKNVPDTVQKHWFNEFPDTEWVLKTVRKCITKRECKRFQQDPEEWAGILSAWLYNEKNPPAKTKETKEWQNPDTGKPDTRDGIERIESLLDEQSLKKFRKFTAKPGAQYAN